MVGVLLCIGLIAGLTEGLDVGASGYGAVVDAGSSSKKHSTSVLVRKYRKDQRNFPKHVGKHGSCTDFKSRT